MKWFRHHSNARDSKKLTRLMLKWGIIGYGMYFYLLESVAEQITSTEIDFEIHYDSSVLADRFKLQGTQDKSPIQIIEEIMSDMIDLNLIQEKDGHLYLYKLAERIDNSIVKNPEIAKIKTFIKQNILNNPSIINPQKQIPETLQKESAFRDFPGYEELQTLFPDFPGNGQISPKKVKIRQNPGQTRLDKTRLELDIYRESGCKKSGKNYKNIKTGCLSLSKILHLDFVYLFTDEYKTLTDLFDKESVDLYISKLNNWIGRDPEKTSGRLKLNHFFELKKWLIQDGYKEKKPVKKKICITCGKEYTHSLEGANGNCLECRDRKLKENWK